MRLRVGPRPRRGLGQGLGLGLAPYTRARTVGCPRVEVRIVDGSQAGAKMWAGGANVGSGAGAGARRRIVLSTKRDWNWSMI